MRILYVITKAERGGAQAHVLALARAALRPVPRHGSGQDSGQTGHEVTVAVGELGWLTNELQTVGVRVETLWHLCRSWSLRHALLYFSELRRLLRRLKPDIVHFHSSNALLGIIAAQSLGAGRPNIVATIHGWSLLHPGWRRSRLLKSLYRVVMRFVLSRANRVILVCEADRELARRQDLVPEAKVRVIHNGIQPDLEFLPREAARRALSAEEMEFIIGTVARADYPKHLELLVRIAAGLQAQNFVWRIVGDGPENEKLRQLIRMSGLGEKVKLLGKHPDPRKLMSGFDVFLMTSRFEGFPYALLEAGLAARPVVATSVGGVPEIIEHGKTGRLAAAGDAAALAREIMWCFENREAARQMGEALREKVRHEFAEQRMVEKTWGVYLEK